MQSAIRSYYGEQEDIFNFQIFAPLVVFNGRPLGEVVRELYNSHLFPLSILSENSNPVFKAIQESSPPFVNEVNFVIIPIRYNKEFLA